MREPTAIERADAIQAVIEDPDLGAAAIWAWESIPATLAVLRAARPHAAADFQTTADIDDAIRALEAIR